MAVAAEAPAACDDGRGVRLIRGPRHLSVPVDPPCAAARSRLLLVAPHASYRIAPFVEAAKRRGVDVFLLAGRSSLSLPSDVAGARFDPADTTQAVSFAERWHADAPFAGICATDDSTAELSAVIASRLGLVSNTPSAAALTRDKLSGRQRLREKRIRCPDFVALDSRDPLGAIRALPGYPLIVKPLAMSASRGVIRVDDDRQLAAALARLRALLEREYANPDYRVVAETFVPGFEVAVEGLLCGGRLTVLAIFDKPDPLHGPYFEETYYTTPSRLSPENQSKIVDAVQAVCGAYGLTEGPVHAECRINEEGVWPLELASRTIGGKCARLLSFATGLTLEEIVIAHALGEQAPVRPIIGGAGVLMVPVPRSGVVRRVEGIGRARAVPGVEEVEIDVGSGEVLTAWPEGGSYPGFVFSRGASAWDAEQSLRRAHAALNIVVAPIIA